MKPRAQQDRCTRSIAEQLADSSGAVRRADHPRAGLHRLDLLDDDALDRYRDRYPEQATAAFEASDLLLEALDDRAAPLDDAARAIEDHVQERPVLVVVVCSECGRFEISRSARPWDVDRAMRRSGVAERDLVRVSVLLTEAWAEVNEPAPRLDTLSSTQLEELRALAGEDVDFASVRAVYGRTG